MKQIYLIFFTFLIFFLSSCINEIENKDKDEDEDKGGEYINTQVKSFTGKVVMPIIVNGPLPIETINKEIFIKNIRKPKFGINLKDKIERLKKLKTLRERDKLLFLKSFLGNYEYVTKQKEKYCKMFNRQIDCLKFDVNFVIEKIFVGDNSFIGNNDNVGIKLDGKEILFNHIFTSSLNYQMNHLIKVYKKGYIGFYNNFYSTRITPVNKYRFKPKIEKYTYTKKINPKIDFSYKTNNFEFIIDKDTFALASGKKIFGNIDLYLFDIVDKDLSIFSLDMFDSGNLSYLGNKLENKSVALVKAYKGNRELMQLKPIRVLSNIHNISIKSDFIDMRYIPKNKILSLDDIKENGLPFIGSLNFDSGKWFSSDLRVFNEKGDIEFILN